MSRVAVRDFRDDLGAASECVRELASPVQLPGARLTMLAEPKSGEALSTLLASLDRSRTAAAIVGGGSRSWLGNPLQGVQLGVSTAGLAGIEELDEADGVVRVRAGTPVEQVAAEALRVGWRLEVDSPGEGGTVGGALAAGLSGPRRLAFGSPRDSVLGLEVVLANGARTTCGARVVKNVTGYDLAKLYVGSLGTLGVIESAWLRLRAIPSCTQALEASGGLELITRGIAEARRTTAQAVAVVSESLVDDAPGLPAAAAPGGYRLLVEFAGDAPAVEEDRGRMAASGPVREVDAAAIDALGELQVSKPALGLRTRLHVLPTAVEACATALASAGAELVVYPIPGVVYASFSAEGGDAEDPWWLDRVMAALDEARAVGRGQLVIEHAPAFAQGRRDAFGGGEGLGVMRDLKARFDPNRILNPGRFVGSI